VAVVSGPAKSGAPKVIALHGVGIARYLERNQMVRSSENYRLEVLPNDWWGEPLDAMLTRVLLQELTQRLPQSTVFASGGAVSGSGDATVELDVQRVDCDNAGNLVLVAQASVSSVRHPSPVRRNFEIRVPLPSTVPAGQAAATSAAVAEVADDITGMLVDLGRK
jgi:uncharacterized lipoprotein YmbA